MPFFLFLENCAKILPESETGTSAGTGTSAATGTAAGTGTGAGNGTKAFPKSEPEPQQTIAVPQHCFLYACADSFRIFCWAYCSAVHFKYFYYLLL
jgi:hypothetical protein